MAMFACQDCPKDTRQDDYYMVHNALWAKVHPKINGMLCLSCLERRLGRRLRVDDFTDANINWNPRLRDFCRDGEAEPTITTDYSMTVADAEMLAGVAQMDLWGRREVLSTYLMTHGAFELADLFANFIGMANSVVANAADMADEVLITECGVHPDRFESVNLPTIIGACQGVVIAAKCDPTGACHGCAYRVGSIANQSPVATADADFMSFDATGFMCHAYVDDSGSPTKVCVGHAKATKAQNAHG
jgi:hypothetical protein